MCVDACACMKKEQRHLQGVAPVEVDEADAVQQARLDLRLRHVCVLGDVICHLKGRVGYSKGAQVTNPPTHTGSLDNHEHTHSNHLPSEGVWMQVRVFPAKSTITYVNGEVMPGFRITRETSSPSLLSSSVIIVP